ncbi:hypothetical protein [Paenibacillus aquistagni]|uniref:hypothetical protein n=1 Tax=Paenibacillus aquistagni TaxID=1852522 RepID=UPI00145B0B7D|nr:hypothetical protein [Paenibacillus aquistagni]NMM52165.1 hypothetical protein [Paenibacillus aquistagni]
MEVIATDVLSLAALVAAYVGVARGFGLTDKWTHLAAVLIAAVFILVPDPIQQTLITTSVVGLTASGAYQYTKKRSDTK